MSPRRLSLVLFALAAGVAIVGLAGLAFADGHVSLSGERIRIYNLVGTMEIVAGTGSSVTVAITDGGKDANRLSVERGVDGGTHWMAIDYPSDRIVVPQHLSSRSNIELWVRDDGRFGGRESRTNARRVRISGSGSGIEAWSDLRISVPPGQDVSVYLGAGEANVTNVDGKLRVDCSTGDVTTKGTRGALSVDTGSGSVRVRDAQGAIAIDTGSGDVEAANLNCDALAVDTGSGSIHLTNATAKSVALDTGSGDVDCESVTSQRLAIDTGSGSVGLDLTRDVESLAVDTGSGNVTISAPESLGASVIIETGSGSISTDFPFTIRRKDDDSLRGTIGDGEGQIHVETGSGDVRLVKRTG